MTARDLDLRAADADRERIAERLRTVSIWRSSKSASSAPTRQRRSATCARSSGTCPGATCGPRDARVGGSGRHWSRSSSRSS